MTNPVIKALKGLGGRQEEHLRQKDSRIADMIRENFRDEDTYRDTQDLDSEESKKLFTPTYAKVLKKLLGKKKQTKGRPTTKRLPAAGMTRPDDDEWSISNQ
jgi:hemerythrin-like domain-containing protein